MTAQDQVEACRAMAFDCEHKALAASEEATRLLYWRLATLWHDIGRLTAEQQKVEPLLQ